LEVVAHNRTIETVSFGQNSELDKFTRTKLLSGSLIAEGECHCDAAFLMRYDDGKLGVADGERPSRQTYAN
jgi:hypothetical protein